MAKIPIVLRSTRPSLAVLAAILSARRGGKAEKG
jgi:hypothetical protein